MYQVNLSVSKENMGWFNSIENALELRTREFCGVVAHKLDNSRLNISVAAEPQYRNQINKAIKETLVDMYSRVCKMEYLKKKLNLPRIGKSELKILLHTLVAFDRECEREIIESAFSVSSGMTLDGIYVFRLKELKERWNDICKLTEENAVYLADESAFTELIRFLISAINPKIHKVIIRCDEEGYSLIGESDDEKVLFDTRADDLIYYLVDLAPMEIVLMGEFKDHNLYNQIIMLFDAKHCSKRVRRG